MRLFESMASMGHEQVTYWSEPASGYQGIIAVHDTSLGPALGGTRFWSYGSEEEALTDVLRLSRAMTLKAAVAGLDLGAERGSSSGTVGPGTGRPCSGPMAGRSTRSADATTRPRTWGPPRRTWPSSGWRRRT